MKKAFLTILVLSLVLPLFSQGRSGLQVGLEVGTNLRFGSGVSPRPGADAGADLRYVFLAPVGYASRVGFQVGAGLGYQTSYQRSSVSSQADITAYSTVADGSVVPVPIRYTVSADAVYQDKQWKLTVPLLLAFRFGAFALDLGPRFAMGISPVRSLAFSNGTVDAYLVDYDVHITDDPSIGVFPADGQSVEGASGTPFALSGVMALGYEWHLGRNGMSPSRYNSPYALEATERFVTLQFFAEYPFWQSSQAAMPDVSLSATAFPAPQISLPALAKPVTFGVRVAYTIFPGSDQRYRCYCFK
ncbi:MAG: hypothetical protein J6Y00_03970 [Paludibacteraceae bacterium]|nr:hypothetical protein [Paludibacteraceae bacterium]